MDEKEQVNGSVPCLEEKEDDSPYYKEFCSQPPTELPADFKWPETVPPMLPPTKKVCLPKLQTQRLLGQTNRVLVEKQCQLTKDLINRLSMSTELQGHRGCVNCIEFNENGRFLVSGSDDYRLLLWDVHSRKKLRSYTTSHTGNIFSVKFLPSNGTGVLVSGAGDKKVEVRDIECDRLLHTCTCHTNSQYDLREPHKCDGSSCNVVVNLRSNRNHSYPFEVKCATLNPQNPHILAVGANDPFVRVYDRRMVKLSSLHRETGMAGSSSQTDSCDHIPFDCCQYYVPGHLPESYKDLQRKLRSLATTYLSYSSDGRHLLANLGGENIYMYDTKNKVPPVRFSTPPFYHESIYDWECLTCSRRTGSVPSEIHGPGETRTPPPPITPPPPVELPPHVEALKLKANEKFNEKAFVPAVMLYSEALQLCQTSPILYCNRAAALMHRNWEGDMYAALRDCFRALSCDIYNVKAFQRMAKCLHSLSRDQEAKLCLDQLFRQNKEAHDDQLTKKIYNEVLNAFLHTPNIDYKCNRCIDLKIPLKDKADQPEYIKKELSWRANAQDFVCHYSGHCNTTTDIKEAIFLGQSGDFIAAGSDDGNLFIWETATGNVVRLLLADENIVNCVQCHPNASLMATSGIGHSVKLWEPGPQEGPLEESVIESATRLNQTRMNSDPLEMLFMHMGDLAQVFSNREGGEQREEEEEEEEEERRNRHAYEFLRVPRRDSDNDGDNGGGGVSGPANIINVSEVPCRTC